MAAASASAVAGAGPAAAAAAGAAAAEAVAEALEDADERERDREGRDGSLASFPASRWSSSSLSANSGAPMDSASASGGRLRGGSAPLQSQSAANLYHPSPVAGPGAGSATDGHTHGHRRSYEVGFSRGQPQRGRGSPVQGHWGGERERELGGAPQAHHGGAAAVSPVHRNGGRWSVDRPVWGPTSTTSPPRAQGTSPWNNNGVLSSGEGDDSDSTGPYGSGPWESRRAHPVHPQRPHPSSKPGSGNYGAPGAYQESGEVWEGPRESAGRELNGHGAWESHGRTANGMISDSDAFTSATESVSSRQAGGPGRGGGRQGPPAWEAGDGMHGEGTAAHRVSPRRRSRKSREYPEAFNRIPSGNSCDADEEGERAHPGQHGSARARPQGPGQGQGSAGRVVAGSGEGGDGVRRVLHRAYSGDSESSWLGASDPGRSGDWGGPSGLSSPEFLTGFRPQAGPGVSPEHAGAGGQGPGEREASGRSGVHPMGSPEGGARESGHPSGPVQGAAPGSQGRIPPTMGVEKTVSLSSWQSDGGAAVSLGGPGWRAAGTPGLSSSPGSTVKAAASPSEGPSDYGDASSEWQPSPLHSLDEVGLDKGGAFPDSTAGVRGSPWGLSFSMTSPFAEHRRGVGATPPGSKGQGWVEGGVRRTQDDGAGAPDRALLGGARAQGTGPGLGLGMGLGAGVGMGVGMGRHTSGVPRVSSEPALGPTTPRAAVAGSRSEEELGAAAGTTTRHRALRVVSLVPAATEIIFAIGEAPVEVCLCSCSLGPIPFQDTQVN